MKNEVYVEEALLEVLNETDLTKFQAKLCVDLQLCRLEHFDHVTDDELHLAGLSIPSIRRLRLAIVDKKKKSKKSKGIFSTVGKKDGQSMANMTKVVLATDVIPAALPSTSKTTNTTTCLIAKEEIFLAERLGEGSFAVVKRATWKRADGVKMDVAVKILRDPSTEIMEDLQQEVNNMQRLQHPNLIRLYGIVFSNPAMMVVEFCDGGALVDRLRSVDKPVLLISTLLDYSLQIAKGMTYLESKHSVHRDLAARNVLLTDSERTVKICDFGLMRVLNENERLYTMSAQKKIPFAWCPPESLRYRQFSRASDVWAFGVTLWELFSYGEEPWAGCRGVDVLTKLEAGERLQRPQRCSAELFDLISTCWSSNVDVRPRFSLLKGILADIKFTIVECRENHIPEDEFELELHTNDRVIVIEGSGVIWYGQNIRTRKFGKFRRSAIHVRNDQNGVMPADANTSSGQPVAKEPKLDGSERISRPIPGSFIHAGHGDINPSQCWGQPERIDDIYLKNPILRKDGEIKSEPRRPQFIPSVVSMQTPSNAIPAASPVQKLDEKPLSARSANENSVISKAINQQIYSSSNVDPFAPFSEYYYDAFDENSFDTSWKPAQHSMDNSAFSTLNAPPVSLSYDVPPLEPVRVHQLPSSSTAFYGKVEQKSAVLPKNEQDGKVRHPSPPLPSYVITSNRVNSSPSVSHTEPRSDVGFKTLNSGESSRQTVPSSDSSAHREISTSEAGHPFELPPPTNVTKPASQAANIVPKSQDYIPKSRPVLSSSDVQRTTGAVDIKSVPGGRASISSKLSTASDAHSASSSNLKTPLGGISKAPASLAAMSSSSVNQLAKAPSASLNNNQKFRSVSTPKLADSASAKSTNFNGPSYFAASAREACNENSFINQARKTSENSRPPAGADLITTVLKPANDGNSSGSFKETTFAVTIPSSIKNIENKDLVQKSAAVSAKVSLATKTLGSGSSSSNSGTSVPNPSVSILSALKNDGPDPFEISSSVKSIANRGRYSDVFIHNSTDLPTSLAQPSSATKTSVNHLGIPLTASSTTPIGTTTLSFPFPSSLKDRNTNGFDTQSTMLNVSASGVNSATIPSSNGIISSQPSTSVVMRPQNGNIRNAARVSSVAANCNYSTSTATVLGQKIPNQVIYGVQQRTLTHRDSTPIFGGYGPISPLQQDGRLSNVVALNFQPPYYWQPGQFSFPSTLTPQQSSSFHSGNRTALVYDANLSNSPRGSQVPRNFTDLPLNNAQNIPSLSSTSSGNRLSASVTDEILGLFDPLASSISTTSSGDAKTENQAGSKGTIDAVLKKAVFAGREKCAVMLRKCNNDVEKAVRELKVEELLSMGLTHDRSNAITVLEDCHWDLNAAASALLA